MIETERLYLREMTMQDFDAIARILQDKDVMVAYEGAFDDTTVLAWIQNQKKRYIEDGFGLWAVVVKKTDSIIGQCGITLQDVHEQRVKEIGYVFAKAYWHQGYAIEAAQACKRYGFETLHAMNLYSIIRDTNQASKQVALRNGMTCVDQIVKTYRGVVMPHEVYRITEEEYRTSK